MQGSGDGLGWYIAPEHMTLQHAGVLITGHEGKVPTVEKRAKADTHHSKDTQRFIRYQRCLNLLLKIYCPQKNPNLKQFNLPYSLTKNVLVSSHKKVLQWYILSL